MDEQKEISLAVEHTMALFGENPGIINEAAMLDWLCKRVRHLLDHDFNSLVNLLYRIDVYEDKAKNCFGKQNQDIADCLAKLIWERQLQKVRKKNNN